MTQPTFIERVAKGISNSRRCRMLFAIAKYPGLSEVEIADLVGIRHRNAFEHLRRLTIAGLVYKQRRGVAVVHNLTPLGKNVYAFVRKLK